MPESKATAVGPNPIDALAAGGDMWIDHVAIAVPDLDRAVAWYTQVLGFDEVERRTTQGVHTTMRSAVLRSGAVALVIVQGGSPESQVSRYIEHFGPGVQHIAIGVRDLKAAVDRLKRAGVQFNTDIIEGDGISQVFTARDPSSGMMYEFIERQSPDARFTDENVRQMYEQLERNNSF